MGNNVSECTYDELESWKDELLRADKFLYDCEVEGSFHDVSNLDCCNKYAETQTEKRPTEHKDIVNFLYNKQFGDELDVFISESIERYELTKDLVLTAIVDELESWVEMLADIEINKRDFENARNLYNNTVTEDFLYCEEYERPFDLGSIRIHNY